MALVRFIDAAFSRWRRRFFPSPEKRENLEHWLGRRGEELAAAYLRRNRRRILYRNFRAPHGGEVDIVCRDKRCNTLVFVEVKTRRSFDFGGPAAAVNLAKQELITRGALAWLRLLDNPDVRFRFDIVEVVITRDGTSCNVIEDAFQLPDRYVW
jgi:putative endonuclease